MLPENIIEYLRRLLGNSRFSDRTNLLNTPAAMDFIALCQGKRVPGVRQAEIVLVRADSENHDKFNANYRLRLKLGGVPGVFEYRESCERHVETDGGANYRRLYASSLWYDGRDNAWKVMVDGKDPGPITLTETAFQEWVDGLDLSSDQQWRVVSVASCWDRTPPSVTMPEDVSATRTIPEPHREVVTQSTLPLANPKIEAHRESVTQPTLPAREHVVQESRCKLVVQGTLFSTVYDFSTGNVTYQDYQWNDANQRQIFRTVRENSFSLRP